MDGQIDFDKKAKEAKKIKIVAYMRVGSIEQLSLEEQKKCLESRRKETGKGGR